MSAARTCGKCRRYLRYDEHLSYTYIEGWGGGHCCPACIAESRGEPAPEPLRYPVGADIPKIGTGMGVADMPICGLCRTALAEDQEHGTPLRIAEEMAEEYRQDCRCEVCGQAPDQSGRVEHGPSCDEEGGAAFVSNLPLCCLPIPQPGAYIMCRDCVAVWKPRRLAWLKRMCLTCHKLDCTEDGHRRHLPETATERNVSPRMLL